MGLPATIGQRDEEADSEEEGAWGEARSHAPDTSARTAFRAIEVT
jgi:hypothetical protein